MASAIAVRSASAVGGQIAGKLAELVGEEATLLWKFKDDVDHLKETMEFVNALMHDADTREASHQGQGELVRLWMKRFKSVAYDVEDLLDKFEAIELLRQNQSKMKLFFSSCNPLFVRVTLGHKIKKVKKDLDIIKEDGRSFNLVPNYNMPRSDEGSTIQATIPWTNEDVDIGMIGRDAEKENIMKLLVKEEAEERISIIPIIGLGGLGKTTLAQAILSDKIVKTIFGLQVWVFVSKNFDLKGIGATIISNASAGTGGSVTSEGHKTPENGDLTSIIKQLKTILSNKRYLIVLDDIWEVCDDDLQKLQQMLQHGAKGSKVILTTRMQHVVERLDFGVLAEQRIIRPVRESDRIKLTYLSDDNCWNVMRQSALGQDDGVVARLEEIGREIAKKCGGLPLLARSIGFVLSQNKSTDHWEDVRDRHNTLGITVDHESPETLERLMLSYYYMPFKVKLCFTYCAVFPKGFTIPRDHLIKRWRALGYIQSVHDHYYINYLLGTSFLMISKTSTGSPGDSKAANKVTMHDLVHDLATMIAGNELIIADAYDKMTWTGPKRHYSRHMRLHNGQKQQKVLEEFPGKIRSLQVTECSGIQLHQKSLSKSQYLRVLDISGCSIDTVPSSISLPSSIYHLMLLRYLDASSLPITCLPKSLQKLQNMQTLIMSNCALETLPDSIGCLHKLLHLDLSGNKSLNKLPISFGDLSELSFLKLSACSKLDELPVSIDKLEGLRHLDMSDCSALESLPDNFGSLPKLLFLNLSGCSKLVKLPDSVSLKSLEHLNLSSCHELQSLPQDFGNLEKLDFLNFSDCYKVRLLPESFCQLKHLKDLDLSDCHDLKELPECFGNLSELQSLDVTSCSKLQSLPESFGGLSKLKRLNLSYCIRLEYLPSSFCGLKLQALYMKSLQNLCKLPDGIGNMTSLKVFEVYTGKTTTNIDMFVVPSILRSLQLHHRAVEHTVHDVHEVDYGWHSSIVNIWKFDCHHLDINHLDRVDHPEDAERAKLRDNPNLRELRLSWDHADRTENKREAEVLENLIPPRTLEGFELIGYMGTNFPKWMLEISSYLPYLTTIQLIKLACDALPPLGMLPNLRLLRIQEIPNIMKIGKEFYGEEGACKKLRVIELVILENLEEWWTTRSGEEEDGFLIPNLHRLDVYKCPKLKFLPYPPKSMYWDLRDSDEVLPPAVHGFGRLSSSTLPFEARIKSSSFTADKWGPLQHLSTLEGLTLDAYGRLLSSLPEATPCFPCLRRLFLSLVGLEILPEWLGQLSTLEELTIWFSPSLRSLPESIQNLTALKKLFIQGCPRLIERCMGEDAHKISHIPLVQLDDTIIFFQGHTEVE